MDEDKQKKLNEMLDIEETFVLMLTKKEGEKLKMMLCDHENLEEFDEGCYLERFHYRCKNCKKTFPSRDCKFNHELYGM